MSSSKIREVLVDLPSHKKDTLTRSSQDGESLSHNTLRKTFSPRSKAKQQIFCYLQAIQNSQESNSEEKKADKDADDTSRVEQDIKYSSKSTSSSSGSKEIKRTRKKKRKISVNQRMPIKKFCELIKFDENVMVGDYAKLFYKKSNLSEYINEACRDVNQNKSHKLKNVVTEALPEKKGTRRSPRLSSHPPGYFQTKPAMIMFIEFEPNCGKTPKNRMSTNSAKFLLPLHHSIPIVARRTLCNPNLK